MDYCNFNMEKCCFLFILSIFVHALLIIRHFYMFSCISYIYFHIFHYLWAYFGTHLFPCSKTNIFTYLFLYVFTNLEHV